jgi:predicted small secreted protein
MRYGKGLVHWLSPEFFQTIKGPVMFNIRNIFTTGIILVSFVTLASCANTIRGVGRDTASAVTSTKTATHDVARAVK